MSRAERREKILETAARLFSSRRFDEVLMDDIAHEAGVAKGTLYCYFPAKEELYFAVVFEGVSRLNEELEGHAGHQLPPEQKLRAIMHAIVTFLHENRFFFYLMYREENRTEGGGGENRRRWHRERGRQMEVIEAVLRSGEEEGVFQFRNLHMEARVLRGMVRSILHCRDNDLTIDEMVETILRIFLHGVLVRS